MKTNPPIQKRPDTHSHDHLTCQIPEGWKVLQWGDIATLEYGKGLRGYDNALGPFRVFGTNGPIGWHAESLCSTPTVVVGRKGAYRGIHYSSSPCYVIDTAFYLKPKVDFDMRWAYYQLLTQDINGMDSGSAIPSTSRDSFYNLDLKMPPLPQQRAIAKILSDLDEKIELNQQMNKTLEAVAQAFFKRWFVDFNFPDEKGRPYKDSGGRMVDYELGEIPEGWRVGTLGEIIEIESGKRPGAKSEIKTPEFSIPLLGASSVMGFVKESLYSEPILVIGRVGTHGVVQRVSIPSFPSDNTLVIKSKHFEFAHQILKSINYDALNVGTTQPLITQTAINKYPIILPGVDLRDRYEKAVSGFFGKVAANIFENETLNQIRDSLLPKLMSGRIK